MKQVYRDGFESYEEFLKDRDNLLPQEELTKSHKMAIDRLTTAQSQIPMLAEKMRISTDISEEDRRYYTSFIKTHLENIERWLRDI